MPKPTQHSRREMRAWSCRRGIAPGRPSENLRRRHFARKGSFEQREGSFEQREGILRANSKVFRNAVSKLYFATFWRPPWDQRRQPLSAGVITKMSQGWAKHLESKATTKELQGLWRQSLGEFLSSQRASHKTPKLHVRMPDR